MDIVKKNKIFFAGFLLFFCSFFFTVSAAASYSNVKLAADSTASTSSLTSKVSVPADTGLPNPSGGVKTILSRVLVWVLGIFGILALISFVIAGIQYFVSAGNDNAMQNAKRNMTFSIIGVVIGLAGVVIVKAIDIALRGSDSTF